MTLLVVTVALAIVLIGLAILRVSRIAGWRAVAMVAVATGSFRACVEFIRLCERL
jgi:hypothetical protein